MSLITFRDKNFQGKVRGPTWYLRFDALTLEDFGRDAEVTRYPIEAGAILSDHYQPLPRDIVLNGVVSDTPSGPISNIEELQDAAMPPRMQSLPLRLDTAQALDQLGQSRLGRSGVLRPVVTGPLPSRRLVRGNLDRARLYIPQFAQTLQAVTPANRIKLFSEVLDGLVETRTQVNAILQSGLEYLNMMIKSFRAGRVAGRGGEISVTINLEQITVADPAVTVKSSQVRTSTKNDSKRSKGTRGTKYPRKEEVPRIENLSELTGLGIDDIAALGIGL